MAASPVEKTKHEINQSGGEESDENEAEKSLDDFLRDTNELVTSTTQDDAKSPASSDDMDGEFCYTEFGIVLGINITWHCSGFVRFNGVI